MGFFDKKEKVLSDEEKAEIKKIEEDRKVLKAELLEANRIFNSQVDIIKDSEFGSSYNMHLENLYQASMLIESKKQTSLLQKILEKVESSGLQK